MQDRLRQARFLSEDEHLPDSFRTGPMRQLAMQSGIQGHLLNQVRYLRERLAKPLMERWSLT
jgi:hypothetical protein